MTSVSQPRPCDTCGNVYDKSFEVTHQGAVYTFDCFECAAHRLAPHCAHCGCTVLGHGVEENDIIYCCAHCARHEGAEDLKDRGDGSERIVETTM